MAVKVVHVSDISGMEAEVSTLGRLVVHQHPGYEGLPVELEALPEEVEALQAAERFVTVEWFQPGSKRGKRLTVSLDDFNRLGEAGRMNSAIDQALFEKHRSTKGGTPSSTGKRRTRARVDYATLEYAGEPHRGRITEAEKSIVRENLELVNKRLRSEKKREIDPNNTIMKERYGL
jgi:hypothetical protein